MPLRHMGLEKRLEVFVCCVYFGPTPSEEMTAKVLLLDGGCFFVSCGMFTSSKYTWFVSPEIPLDGNIHVIKICDSDKMIWCQREDDCARSTPLLLPRQRSILEGFLIMMALTAGIFCLIFLVISFCVFIAVRQTRQGVDTIKDHYPPSEGRSKSTKPRLPEEHRLLEEKLKE